MSRFKAEAPHFKAPEDEEVLTVETAPAPAPVSPAPLAVDSDWSDMDVAPKDGSPVILTPDLEEVHEAVWRKTTQFSKATGRFEPTGFWARRNAGGQKIGFSPLGWRPGQ